MLQVWNTLLLAQSIMLILKMLSVPRALVKLYRLCCHDNIFLFADDDAETYLHRPLASLPLLAMHVAARYCTHQYARIPLRLHLGSHLVSLPSCPRASQTRLTLPSRPSLDWQRAANLTAKDWDQDDAEFLVR